MKEQKGGSKLPEPIKIAIDTFGLAYNEFVWDKETGQPGTFLRLIIRKQMEDRGGIPHKSSEGNE